MMMMMMMMMIIITTNKWLSSNLKGETEGLLVAAQDQAINTRNYQKVICGVVSKAIMMHSIVNNTAPEYLTSRFVRGCAVCDLTSYNLRENKYKLPVPQPLLNFIKEVFVTAEVCYGTACLWRCGNLHPLESLREN